MYCTNCHHTNQNVKTCRSKKEEPTITTIEAITHANKPPKPLNYPCHICGIMKHKLMNYPIFGEMQIIFKDKALEKILKSMNPYMIDFVIIPD